MKHIKNKIKDNEEEIITLLRWRYGKYREEIGFWKGIYTGTIITFLFLFFMRLFLK